MGMCRLTKINPFNFICLQETKRERNDFLFDKIWGRQSCEWIAKPSVGLSGDILTTSLAGTVVVKNSFSRPGFSWPLC